MDYESEDHQVDSSEEQGSQQFSETMSSKSSEMAPESPQRSASSAEMKSESPHGSESAEMASETSKRSASSPDNASESSKRSASSAELSHSQSSNLSYSSSSQKSASKEDSSIEVKPEKFERTAAKSGSGVKTLSKEDKLLRMFLIIGFFPLPVLGWIIGFFYSFSIKRKTKSQKKVLPTNIYLIRNKDDAKDKDKDKEPKKVVEKSEEERDLKGPKVDVDVPDVDIKGPKVQTAEDKKAIEDRLRKKENLTISDTESLRVNLEDLNPEQKELRAEVFKSVTDVDKAKKLKVEEGLYVPAVLDKFEVPEFKIEKPENLFIPPRILKSPVPVSKSAKDIKFDFFEYVHPSSTSHMLILLRGLNSTWKNHELFRFSEYVNHSVMAVNVTDAGKKTISQILEELEDVVKTKAKKDITLVTEIKQAEVNDFRKLYQEKKFKKVLAISSHLRCQESNEVFDMPEFVGLFDDKIECDKKNIAFPVMVVKNDLVEYEIMENELEIGLKFVEMKKCKDVLNTKEQTKIVLGKLFGPFRKFATATTASLKEDEVLKKVLCSRKKYT
ncbi:putative integral membrane protein [Theileria parva strain Muguga]|uniref:Uncharacterized protein n=1 Tax=Theileria parva TaxID=5875 RepID=Q4N2D1_THEPA|nr:putative integral membrane protein [Theileria parva strain Muguga]EAN31772.1 putative integral membrane protein [Theileria parva strain Muguga]|eukprot:XP_764055.1 hypothetical protein [Theileria parva strain Muguga]